MTTSPPDPSPPDPSPSHLSRVTGSPGQPLAPGVRLAMPVEALQIAEIQRRAWAGDEVERRFLALTSVDEVARVWHAAITRPPMAHHRVLVATEPWGAPHPGDQPDSTRLASRVFGFAAFGPSSDDDADRGDAEVMAFHIDQQALGRGHGSRLLHAVVDTLRVDGYRRATWWLRSGDDALRGFLTSAGWAPDGAHRELGSDDGIVRVKQVRLHTSITTTPSGGELHVGADEVDDHT